MSKMADAAARSVKILSKAEAKKVEFSSLDELTNDLKGENLTVELDNTLSGEKRYIEFRHPTPNENATIEGSLLSARVLTELVDSQGKNVSNDVLEETSQQLAHGTLEKMIVTLAICSVQPEGITTEVVRAWDPLWIDAIYSELMKMMRAATKVDRFPEVGSAAGERGSGATTSENGGEK